MAYLDDVVAQVSDPALRTAIARECEELRRHTRFGLVFEAHRPETLILRGAPVRIGALVRQAVNIVGTTYRVLDVRGGEATISSISNGGAMHTLPIASLRVVQDDGDPAYPVLTPIGNVKRGGDKAHHAVINGENLQALPLLDYLFGEQADCIYIDPPYNTGARDWKYNNAFVDAKDHYRHSKWLAFMRRRLRLARGLLKPDGVLVVTIDANEVHHLGMLLEQLFPEALVQMVTVAINPSGATGDGFSRVDEYAYFVFFGGARPSPTFEDFFGPEGKTRAAWWESLLRRGDWPRSKRKNLCYPILVDEHGHIAGAGEPFRGEDESARPTRQGDYELAWPVRNDGTLGIWRVDAARLLWMFPLGYAVTTVRDPHRGTWSVRYLLQGAVDAIESGALEVQGLGPYGEVILAEKVRSRVIPKTVWHRARHAAGATGGTNLLTALLGSSGAFSYPKSVYAVRDALDAAVGDRPNALIVDFFAGSGTTLHATCLLNAADNGRRRCVLVTNNEVDEATAIKLQAEGHHTGDPDFERHGVFERATRPRCEAAVRGVRPDGMLVEGEDMNGRPYAAGFDENVTFFRLDYIDPDEAMLGLRLDAILPALWLAAGGQGECPTPEPGTPWMMGGGIAVLLDEAHFARFRAALKGNAGVRDVWLVTDSPEAFAWMNTGLQSGATTPLRVRRLYEDYLDRFRTRTTEQP